MVHNFSVFFLVCLFVCLFVYFYLLPIRIAKDLPSAFQAYMVSSFTDKDRLTKWSSSFEWILYRKLVLKISTSSHNKNCSKSLKKKIESSIFFFFHQKYFLRSKTLKLNCFLDEPRNLTLDWVLLFLMVSQSQNLLILWNDFYEKNECSFLQILVNCWANE